MGGLALPSPLLKRRANSAVPDLALCEQGQVTYCGINADGGAIARPGSKRYAEGMNWACQDQLSNLDPTYIAPNCHGDDLPMLAGLVMLPPVPLIVIVLLLLLRYVLGRRSCPHARY